MAKLKWALLSALIGGTVGVFIDLLLSKEPEEFTRIYGYKSTDKEKYYDSWTEYPDGKGGTVNVTDEQVAELVKEHLHPSDRSDIRKICEAREVAWELLSGCQTLEDLNLPKECNDIHGKWYW